MGADIEHAAFAAASLDTAFEPPVMGAAPVLEIAEGELALHQERAVAADAMLNRPRRSEIPIEVYQGSPGGAEPPQRTMAQLAKGGDD